MSAYSLTPSTTATGASADLAISATRSGTPNDDVKQVGLKLPVGASYSVSGVATKCTLVQFSADVCPVASRVGTVNADANAGILGFVLLSGNVPGTSYALTSGEIGTVYRPSGFSKIWVTSTISGSPATGIVLTTGTYPRTSNLIGLIPLDVTFEKLNFNLQGTSGAASLYKNPTACGAATSTVTLVPHSGASASKSSSYNVTGCGGGDTTLPVVHITAPANGASLTTSPVAVNYTVTDNDPAPTCTRTNGQPFTLAEGSNTITVSCTDAAGNTGSDAVVVTYTAPDTQGPTVTISSPANGSTTTTSPVAVVFSAVDNRPGAISCTRNGSPISSGDSVSLVPGSNTITIVCTDLAGNPGTGATTVTYNPPPVDQTPPSVHITAPANNTVTGAPTAAISYTATDDLDTSLDCTLNGNPFASGSSVNLNSGSNSFTVICTDDSGKTGSDSVTIIRDTQGPTVLISQPANGSSTDQSSVVVLFSAADDHDLSPSCTRNGSPISSGDSVSLVPGSNTITIVCTDASGNPGTGTTTVTYNAPPVDQTPPSVDITSPASGTVTAASQVAIVFSATDDLDTSLDCTTGSGAFASGDQAALAPGSNTITVTCTDDSGKSGSDSVTVIRDNQGPTVNISSPVSGSTVGTSSVPVVFTATDDNPGAVSCTRNGSPISSGDSVSLDPGPNTITIVCTDALGNPGTGATTVTYEQPPVDQTPPSVEITSPADGTITGSASIPVTFTATDDLDTSLDCTAGSGAFTSGSSVALVSGSNTITVTCTDDSGKTGSDSVTVIRDTQGPTVAISAPVDGSSTDQSSVPVDFTATDDNPGAVTCTRNGSPITTGASVSLSPGSNTITIVCTDAYGNAGSASTTVTYNAPPVDQTPPSVEITSPADGTITGSASIPVTFTATDDLDTSLSCDFTSGDSAPLVSGSNTITVTCTDDSGKSGSDSVTVIRDTQGPTVAISAPVDGSSTDQSSTTVSFTATDDNPGTVTCTRNGSPITTGASVSLSPGSNTITIVCTDAYGNSGSATTTVTYNPPPVDQTPPSVEITSPADGTITGASSIAVTYTATDDLDTSLGCNIVSGSSVSLVSGDNTITVTCTDDSGKSGSDSITVVRDTQGPTVAVTAPVNGSTTDQSSVPVTFEATDDHPGTITCTRNGSPITSGASVSLSPGSNTISIVCTDAYGNAGTGSTTVTYNPPPVDQTPPSVEITSPADGTITGASSIAVTYTATDDLDTSLSCNIVSGSSVSLVSGDNTITVTCTDDSGKSGSDSITVIRDTQGPTVAISSPVDGSTINADNVDVVFTATDNNPGAVTCTRNGSPFTSGTNVTLVEGSNTITISCTDAYGNAGSASSTVTYEIPATPPTTDITDPLAASPTLSPTFNVSSDTPTATFECSINGSPFAACDPNAGTYGASFNDAAANDVKIRAVNNGTPDPTPAETHIWTDTRDVLAHATVDASDTRAGAHPDVSGDITLDGGYNPKSVSVDMPLGLNGALTATSEKCDVIVDPDTNEADANAMDCATSAPGSAVGTLSGVGLATTVGTITDATSSIYLTTPPPDSSSPAGVWVDVKSPSHPELGSIKGFGWVNIKQVDNGVINGEIRQSIYIPKIPEITTAGVRFHATSVHLELLGDPPGGTYPLITNPTTCDTHTFEGDGKTWSSDGAGGDGPDVPHLSVDYPVTDCGTLEFNPVLDQEFFMTDPIDGSTYDPDDPGSSVSTVGTSLQTNLTDWRNGVAGTVATLTNGTFSTTARRAAIREMTVLQPQGTGANFAALSGAGATCPGSAASATGLFDVNQCSPAAQVGTISISTPLLADPLEGTVWLINNTPLPWIGIFISPDTGPSNPAGVTLALTARTDLTCASTAPSCTDATYKRVTVTLNNLPDVPMDSVTLDLSGRTARAHNNDGDPMPTLILAMPDAGSAGCLASDNVYANIQSGTGTILNQLVPTSMDHCAFGAPSPTVSRNTPSTTPTNSTTQTFNITNPGAGAGATLLCRLDRGAWAPCTAGTNVSLVSGLTEGNHTFSVRAVNAAGDDASAIANVNWTVDLTPPPPLATLTKNAASNGTVTFAFTGRTSGTSLWCSRDGGAYSTANCGTPAATATGTITWTGVVAGSGSHTIAVQVRDSAGNASTDKTVTWTA